MSSSAARPLRVLQVNTFDSVGGAARVARNLFEIYRSRGHDSWLAVGHRQSRDPNVLSLAVEGAGSSVLQRVLKAVEFQLGIEDLRFSGSEHLLEMVGRVPDILHAHNLHGGYFDLRAIAPLSQRLPVVLTLHDAWLLSGHCGHSLDCERWRTGCGHCPDLTLDPPVRRDATAYNWRRKARIFDASRLHVATPSRWLMDKVDDSMLAPAAVERVVIPNGVDLSIFKPGDRRAAREALALPPDAKVLLFSAYALRQNVWKDFKTVRTALGIAAERLPQDDLVLVALGEGGPAERIGRAHARFVPYQGDPAVVADYYRAADAYVHATRADTFPNTVMEALACGTPVVATAVGGIPEQIDEGQTGFLAPSGDAEALAARLVRLLSDDALSHAMSRHAADAARRRFDLQRQADAYLAWYGQLSTGPASAAATNR